MGNPDYPNEQRLARIFVPITDPLHLFLPVFAKERVVPYFSQDGLPVDGTVASPMIRYATKRMLMERFPSPSVADASSASTSSLTFRWLPGHGIECVYRGFAFKFLRARNGGVPVAGNSAYRRNFYNNRLTDFQLPLGGVTDEMAKHRQHPNVIVLWDFDPTYEHLILRLALPNRADGPWTPVECIYIVDVPAPMPDEAIPESPADLLPITTDDLPVENIEPLDEYDAEGIPVDEIPDTEGE